MDPLLKKTTIRFLSFTGEKEDVEKETKLKEAAATIEKAIARDRALDELVDYEPPPNEGDVDDLDPANDMRPLYERLLEQRNKKKEALEDAQKLSNLVSTLDDEDVSHLNQMAKNKQEEEIKRRLEVFDALENKKRLDEQKALEESRSKKEALLNINNIKKESQIRSRLSSMMKIKPKIKQLSNQAATSSEMDAKTNNNDVDEDTSSNQRETKRPNDGEELNKSAIKKPPIDTTTTTTDVTPPSPPAQGSVDDKSVEPVRSSDCTCLKYVTKPLGVLPSLPITRRSKDSSDDSDLSDDDDDDHRIMPKIRRK